MKSFKSAVFLIMLTGSLHSQSAPVALPATETYPVYSVHVKDTFYLQISFPASDKKEQETRFPVIYLLDSDRSFGLVKGIVEWPQFDGLIPPIMVVGIAYKQDW